MNRSVLRSFSTSFVRTKAQPRHRISIQKATKPAQKESVEITSAVGLDSPVLLNHNLSDTYKLNNLYHELFSPEAKEARQKKLDYEMEHSPLHDSKSFHNTNGKIFTPPVSYLKPERSKYFPDFYAKTLDGNQRSLYEALGNKISLVNIFSTITGEKCTRSYYKTDDKDYYLKDYNEFIEKNPNVQILDVNIPQNWMKGFILNLSISNLKKMVPPERTNDYFILPDRIFQYTIRQELMCDNQCAGFIYILDPQGRIRWLTSGYANPEELTLMWKVIDKLQEELASSDE